MARHGQLSMAKVAALVRMSLYGRPPRAHQCLEQATAVYIAPRNLPSLGLPAINSRAFYPLAVPAINSDVHLMDVSRPRRGVAHPAPAEEHSAQVMSERLHHGGAIGPYLVTATIGGNTGEYVPMPGTMSVSPGNRRRPEQCPQQQHGNHGRCSGLSLRRRRE